VEWSVCLQTPVAGTQHLSLSRALTDTGKDKPCVCMSSFMSTSLRAHICELNDIHACRLLRLRPVTIIVKGFDRYQGEENGRQALTKVFEDCGAVASIHSDCMISKEVA